MKVLINGAYGGLGADIYDCLTADPSRFPCVYRSEGDILAPRQVRKEIEMLKPDVVMHLAAIVGTKDCLEVPRQVYETNVLGTFNVISAAVAAGCRVVYMSSTGIYKPTTDWIYEDSPIDPQTIYVRTKWWGEQIAKAHVPKRDLLIVRPCFTFGGRTDVSMLGALIRSHYQKRYVNLLLDMTKLKDYMHVRNLSYAVKLMLEQERFGTDYNVSYGEPIPYGDLITKLHDLGINPYYKLLPEEDYLGDHKVSNKKIMKELGYTNQVSLDDGIKVVAEHYQHLYEGGTV